MGRPVKQGWEVEVDNIVQHSKNVSAIYNSKAKTQCKPRIALAYKINIDDKKLKYYFLGYTPDSGILSLRIRDVCITGDFRVFLEQFCNYVLKKFFIDASSSLRTNIAPNNQFGIDCNTIDSLNILSKKLSEEGTKPNTVEISKKVLYEFIGRLFESRSMNYYMTTSSSTKTTSSTITRLLHQLKDRRTTNEPKQNNTPVIHNIHATPSPLPQPAQPPPIPLEQEPLPQQQPSIISEPNFEFTTTQLIEHQQPDKEPMMIDTPSPYHTIIQPSTPIMNSQPSSESLLHTPNIFSEDDKDGFSFFSPDEWHDVSFVNTSSTSRQLFAGIEPPTTPIPAIQEIHPIASPLPLPPNIQTPPLECTVYQGAEEAHLSLTLATGSAKKTANTIPGVFNHLVFEGQAYQLAKRDAQITRLKGLVEVLKLRMNIMEVETKAQAEDIILVKKQIETTSNIIRDIGSILNHYIKEVTDLIKQSQDGKVEGRDLLDILKNHREFVDFCQDPSLSILPLSRIKQRCIEGHISKDQRALT